MLKNKTTREYTTQSDLHQQLYNLAVLGLREQMQIIGSSLYIQIEFVGRSPGYTTVYNYRADKRNHNVRRFKEVFYINSPGWE